MARMGIQRGILVMNSPITHPVKADSPQIENLHDELQRIFRHVNIRVRLFSVKSDDT